MLLGRVALCFFWYDVCPHYRPVRQCVITDNGIRAFDASDEHGGGLRSLGFDTLFLQVLVDRLLTTIEGIQIVCLIQLFRGT
ncbi:hypothetical protein D3C84_1006960 [compost metagenome]